MGGSVCNKVNISIIENPNGDKNNLKAEHFYKSYQQNNCLSKKTKWFIKKCMKICYWIYF